jgi:hypothetical protein
MAGLVFADGVASLVAEAGSGPMDLQFRVN